jgi:hypothetical protein
VLAPAAAIEHANSATDVVLLLAFAFPFVFSDEPKKKTKLTTSGTAQEGAKVGAALVQARRNW